MLVTGLSCKRRATPGAFPRNVLCRQSMRVRNWKPCWRTVSEEIPISAASDAARFWFVEVHYTDGTPETYTLPVQVASGDAAHAVERNAPHAVIARFDGSKDAIWFDAVWDAGFREKLFR